MPYAHGITKEDVFAAASAIFANGKNPTQAAVRSSLGKGSFSTISKYLSEWKEQQTDAESLVTDTDDMPDQVRLLLNRTYAAIRSHAESVVVGEQTTLLEQENERLREENTILKQDLVDLPGLRSAYHDALNQMQQVTRENERIAKYLPQIDQVEELLGKVNQLEVEKSELQVINEDLELTKVKFEDQAITCQRNLDTSIQRANEMGDELLELRTSNSRLNSQLTQVADRNQELLEQVDTCQDALAVKLAEIEELKAELKIAREPKSRSRKPKVSDTSPDAK